MHPTPRRTRRCGQPALTTWPWVACTAVSGLRVQGFIILILNNTKTTSLQVLTHPTSPLPSADGPVSLLSGLNPRPSVLVMHFFMVALFGVGRWVLYRWG